MEVTDRRLGGFTIRQWAEAFLDVVDGSSAWYEIQANTGLPEGRCQELSSMASAVIALYRAGELEEPKPPESGSETMSHHRPKPSEPIENNYWVVRIATGTIEPLDLGETGVCNPLDEQGLTLSYQCGLWLRERLKFGPVSSSTVEAEAKALGYNKSTLHRAKVSVGAISERIPMRKRGWQLVIKKSRDKGVG